MTDDLVAKLRDEDSYYRLQEKHWCIDAEELERQRLAAADRIEALEAEVERLNSLINATANHWLDLQHDHPIAWEGAVDAAMEAACDEIRRLSAALGDT